MPVKTRWGSIVSCLLSLIQYKSCLQQVLWSEDENIINKLGNIKMVLLDFVFWRKIENMSLILKPLTDWITKLESNQPLVCDIGAIINIQSLLTENLTKVELLSKEEKNLVLKSFEQRKTMALHPIYYASTILEPRIKGANLKPEEDIAGVENMYNVTKHSMNE